MMDDINKNCKELKGDKKWANLMAIGLNYFPHIFVVSARPSF
jgi:hypothetical protein